MLKLNGRLTALQNVFFIKITSLIFFFVLAQKTSLVALAEKWGLYGFTKRFPIGDLNEKKNILLGTIFQIFGKFTTVLALSAELVESLETHEVQYRITKFSGFENMNDRKTTFKIVLTEKKHLKKNLRDEIIEQDDSGSKSISEHISETSTKERNEKLINSDFFWSMLVATNHDSFINEHNHGFNEIMEYLKFLGKM